MRIFRMVYSKTKGRCLYCGSTFSTKWCVGHFAPINFIDFEKRFIFCQDRELLEYGNLFPVCPTCNILKGNLSIEKFRNKFYKKYHSTFWYEQNLDDFQLQELKHLGHLAEDVKKRKLFDLLQEKQNGITKFKIKDNITYKEIKKFGYKLYHTVATLGYYYKTRYDNNDVYTIYINRKTKKIKTLNLSDDYIPSEKFIQDLIKVDLIEKVEE